MAPIEKYFSEERMERSRAKNAEAIGRINEDNRRRMLGAIEAYEGKKKTMKLVMDDKTKQMVLEFYLSGYDCEAIARMMDTKSDVIFRVLQKPLLRSICGAKGMGVFYNNPEHRVLPYEDVIARELEEMGIDPVKFSNDIIERTGCSRRVANRMLRDTNCGIPLPVAVGVCEYFGICADKLFYKMKKEKAAE